MNVAYCLKGFMPWFLFNTHLVVVNMLIVVVLSEEEKGSHVQHPDPRRTNLIPSVHIESQDICDKQQ